MTMSVTLTTRVYVVLNRGVQGTADGMKPKSSKTFALLLLCTAWTSVIAHALSASTPSLGKIAESTHQQLGDAVVMQRGTYRVLFLLGNMTVFSLLTRKAHLDSQVTGFS